MNTQDNKNILIHAHIFKNAGSTFDDSLLANFSNNFVDHREDQLIAKNPEFLEDYLKVHSKIQAFSSHSVYHRPKNFDNTILHTIYFLRHPVERIKSVYSFEKKQPAEDSSGAAMAKKLDFQEYVVWRMQDDVPATIRNIQTIFLAGIGPTSKDITQKYELALQHLKDTFLVGIVDRYDESMIVFEEYLRSYYPQIDLSYIRKNVTDKNLSDSVERKTERILASLGEELSKLVQKNNEYDMELYKKSNALLNQKIAKIANFEIRLSNFKDRCLVKQLQQLSRKKMYGEVLSIAYSRIENRTYNPAIYILAINSLMAENKLEKVIELCDKTIVEFPKNPWAHFIKVEALHMKGHEDKAKKLFEIISRKFADRDDIVKQYAEKLEL